MKPMLYMKLPGIKGEEPIGKDSQDAIAIQSYSHSLTLPVSPMRPSVGEHASFRRSYCQHGLFNVLKGFDKTSPKLFEASAAGVEFENVAIFACGQFHGKKNKSIIMPLLSIHLTRAFIVNFSYEFLDGWQVETIAFQYASIGWHLSWPDPEKGDPGNLDVGWDALKNIASTDVANPENADVKWKPPSI